MSDPASSEPEVAFLRSQVVALQTRLCETLTQQVAQQQTVLIAAMQTNLALTQTVDKLHAISDRLVESIESGRDEPPPSPGTDFGAIITSLMPYLLSSTQPKVDPAQPKAPVPFTLPKEVTDLMRNRSVPQTGPQPSAQPIPAAPAPTGKAQAQAKKTKPKENCT